MPETRIATFLAAATEIVCALGLGDQLVAVSHECDFPAEATRKPRVTATRIDEAAPSGAIDAQVRELTSTAMQLYEVDYAELERLRPTVIITQAHCAVCAVNYDEVARELAARPALRPTRLVALNTASLEGLYRDILLVGAAADHHAGAQELVNRLCDRVNAVRVRTATIAETQRPRVACIEWIDPVMVAANWMPELIELAGGRNGLTRAGERSAYTRWHDVIAFDPQVIVVMPCGFDLDRARQEAEALSEMPSWPELSAVRSGRVYAADGNAYFNRSGPRLVDSLELLAAILHPTLFSVPESCAQVFAAIPGATRSSQTDATE